MLLFVLYLLTQEKVLHYACGIDGKLEAARLAIEKGADPNWKDQVSLLFFRIFFHFEIKF